MNNYERCVQQPRIMFENTKRKSSRALTTAKSISITKMPKGNIPELIQTEADCTLKDKKSKSQCVSKEKMQRKSIDVSKFVQTTRVGVPSGSVVLSKKSKEKKQTVDQIYTEDRHRPEHYILGNIDTQKSTELKWLKKLSLKKRTEGRSAERSRASWNEKNVPLDWQTATELYSHYLTRHELSQIKQYKKIYYLGHRAHKRQRIQGAEFVFDNQEKEYVFVENDHIAYRYEVLSVTGKGSYGQVFKVIDHKTKEELALKVIKNKAKFSKQAFIQIKILTHIKERDTDGASNVVRIRDFVLWRKHVCIIFELLSENLYELIIRNNYSGLNTQLIRRFAIQILASLQFLRIHKIIHCDLKPQNILLKQYNKSGIRIIDFGSSCFQNQTLYTYIQSRYYRAPQITLGIAYNSSIDVWSTGCILAELYTGVPLFPGENQNQQMKYITDTLGVPGKGLLEKGSRSHLFFDQQGKVLPQIKGQQTIEHFSKPLVHRIEDPQFRGFIELFLKWDPSDRATPIQALNHHWIRKGLPDELKNRLMIPAKGQAHSNQKLSKSKEALAKSNEKLMPGKRIKSRSRQKGDTKLKVLGNRASQQKIVKRYGIKF